MKSNISLTFFASLMKSGLDFTTYIHKVGMEQILSLLLTYMTKYQAVEKMVVF